MGERTPTGGDMYARFPGQKRVFLVSSFLDSTFNKNTFALRDKRVISIDRDKVDRIEILKGGKPAVTLTKTGIGLAHRCAADGPRRLRRRRGRTRATVVGARCRASCRPKEPTCKKRKLDPPVATITAGAGSSRATLLFGETENALIYAKDASRPMVFTVAPTLYHRRHPRPRRIPAQRPVRLAVVHRDARRVQTRR